MNLDKMNKIVYETPAEVQEEVKRMLDRQEKIYQRTTDLQTEMHQQISEMMRQNKKLTYDACLTVYLLKKIAELQVDLEKAQ